MIKLVLGCILLCACTRVHTINPVNDVVPQVAEPVADVPSPPTGKTEQEKYEDSVFKIEKQFEEEAVKLKMCESVYGASSKECKELLKEVCSIHMHVDIRGNHHEKPHCVLTKPKKNPY